MTTGRYIHGSHAEEQERLTRLNELINGACLREMGLRAGERVLDVGSGLGQFSRGMARAVGAPGAGRVLGVERDAAQLAEARRQAGAAGEGALVEFRQGDALALPLREGERGEFDVAHARFVLEHVPDPLGVVRGMVAAVRPGGRVVLVDDDHDTFHLWPEPEGVGALWRAYVGTYERLGNDPCIGRKLVKVLHDAGARPVRNTSLFFGSCAGHADFGPLIFNLVRIFEGARGSILEQGLLDDASVERGLESVREWALRPDAALWIVICWAEGVRP